MEAGELPLGEVLITPDVSSFARFAAFPRFRMAFSRRTTTGTSHHKRVRMSKLRSCRVATSDRIAARDSVSRKAQKLNHKPERVLNFAQKRKRSCCSLCESYDEIEGWGTVGTIRGSGFRGART